MRYRIVYFAISGIVIGAGIFVLAKWGLALGIDFTGGSVVEYKFSKEVPEDKIKNSIEKTGIKISSIQKTNNNSYLFKLSSLNETQKENLDLNLSKLSEKGEELRFENVGPAIGPELIKKTIYALVISASLILLWIAYQFKSLKFGISATLATLHDSLVLIGSFAILGYFFGAEIDFLFVTAMLTILSFSVHDTIIVYDRIRESQRKIGGSLYDLANRATTETMVRSFNNSMTIVFMLTALVLLGGSTIKWFAAALLIGTISGTYSSPFVAVPILVTWDEIEKKLRKK